MTEKPADTGPEQLREGPGFEIGQGRSEGAK